MFLLSGWLLQEKHPEEEGGVQQRQLGLRSQNKQPGEHFLTPTVSSGLDLQLQDRVHLEAVERFSKGRMSRGWTSCVWDNMAALFVCPRQQKVRLLDSSDGSQPLWEQLVSTEPDCAFQTLLPSPITDQL